LNSALAWREVKEISLRNVMRQAWDAEASLRINPVKVEGLG
jgi:hypothetical protein